MLTALAAVCLYEMLAVTVAPRSIQQQCYCRGQRQCDEDFA